MPIWPTKVKVPSTTTADKYALTNGSVLFFNAMQYIAIWYQDAGAIDYAVYDLGQAFYTRIAFDKTTNEILVGGPAATTDKTDNYDTTRHHQVFFEQDTIIGTTDVRDISIVQVKNVYKLTTAAIMVKRISASSFDVRYADNDATKGKVVFSLT